MGEISASNIRIVTIFFENAEDASELANKIVELQEQADKIKAFRNVFGTQPVDEGPKENIDDARRHMEQAHEMMYGQQEVDQPAAASPVSSNSGAAPAEERSVCNVPGKEVFKDKNGVGWTVTSILNRVIIQSRGEDGISKYIVAVQLQCNDVIVEATDKKIIVQFSDKAKARKFCDKINEMLRRRKKKQKEIQDRLKKSEGKVTQKEYKPTPKQKHAPSVPSNVKQEEPGMVETVDSSDIMSEDSGDYELKQKLEKYWNRNGEDERKKKQKIVLDSLISGEKREKSPLSYQSGVINDIIETRKQAYKIKTQTKPSHYDRSVY